MIGVDVNLGDAEMGLVHAVCAIDDELLRPETFDELCDFLGPLNRYIFVAKYWTTELIASLISKDCGIFGVRKASVGILVHHKMLYIVLEVLDDSSVGVELHHKWRIVILGDVESSETQEIILSAVVVILFMLVSVCRRDLCPNDARCPYRSSVNDFK